MLAAPDAEKFGREQKGKTNKKKANIIGRDKITTGKLN